MTALKLVIFQENSQGHVRSIDKIRLLDVSFMKAREKIKKAEKLWYIC